MLKRLFELLKDALAYGTSSIAQKIAGFLLIPLYTRHLEPADYGIIAMLVMMQSILEAFILLGQKSAVFREVGLAKEDGSRGGAFTVGLVIVACSGFVTLCLAQLFAPQLSDIFLGPGNDVGLVRIVLISSFLNCLCEMPRMALQADRRAKTAASLTAFQTFTTMLLTVLLVVVLEWGVWGVIASALITLVPFTFIYIGICRKLFGFHWNSELARQLIIYGLPFVPYRVQLMLFAMFGEYLVRTKMGLDEAGCYNIAKRFSLPLAFVVTAITNAWWGYKFHLYKEEEDSAGALSSVSTYVLAGLTYVWVGVSLWSPELVLLLTPAEYHAAAVLVPAIALFLLLTGFQQMLTSGIWLGDNAKPIFVITLTGLIIVVPLGLWALPLYGALGVATSVCVAQLGMNYVGYRLARSRYVIKYDWWLTGLLFVGGIVFVVLGRSFSDLELLPRLGLITGLCLLYPLLVLLLLARSTSERDRMKSVFMHLKNR